MGARDTMARRRVRETRHPIWIADPTEASQALQEAKARLLLGGIGKTDDDPLLVELKRQVAEAEAAVEECVEWLVFRALEPADFETLIQEHPAPEGADEDDVYDEATFFPALLAAATQDSDLTAEEWAEQLASLNAGERADIKHSVMSANTKSWSDSLPKG